MRRLLSVLWVVVLVALPASARAANVSFEGETMTHMPGSGQVQPDDAASGRKTYQNYSNAETYQDVTLTAGSAAVFAVVRADQCPKGPDGAALADVTQMEIRVDSTTVFQGDVPNLTYAEVGGPASIGAGAHRVTVHMTNDSQGIGCDRNLYIDKVTLYAEPFAANSWRNAPLAASVPLRPDSAALVTELARQAGPPWGSWVNTTQYSFPLYVIGREQSPLFDVKVYDNWMPPGYPFPPYDDYFKRVPIPTPLPSGPVISGGVDAALGVWQPATDSEWEFLGMKWDLVNGHQVHRGGRIRPVSTNQGYQDSPAGSDYLLSATGISQLGTIIRIPELQRGVIDHAIGIAIPDPKFEYCWPAQANDYSWPIKNQGFRNPNGTYKELLPEGTRFRLPASLNIDSLNLPRFTTIVAKAVQKYGLVIHDFAGALAFYAEDWRTHWKSDPYSGPNGFFEGIPRQDLFKDFPWTQLEALSVPDRNGDGQPDCGRTPGS
jgi:hypothetical protein